MERRTVPPCVTILWHSLLETLQVLPIEEGPASWTSLEQPRQDLARQENDGSWVMNRATAVRLFCDTRSQAKLQACNRCHQQIASRGYLQFWTPGIVAVM